MLRSGKQRSSANDTTLSDRELRKVEADGVVLEQKLCPSLRRFRAQRVEYERRYPTRGVEPERRAEETGPDRPKRKRVDGRECYANSGEGSKRRCDTTGRPPGRPPG